MFTFVAMAGILILAQQPSDLRLVRFVTDERLLEICDGIESWNPDVLDESEQLLPVEGESLRQEFAENGFCLGFIEGVVNTINLYLPDVAERSCIPDETNLIEVAQAVVAYIDAESAPLSATTAVNLAMQSEWPSPC